MELVDDLQVDEERYQAWKLEREAARTAKREAMGTATATEARHIPLNPQELLTNAARRQAEARAAIHVEAESTESIYAHIDELLKAS